MWDSPPGIVHYLFQLTLQYHFKQLNFYKKHFKHYEMIASWALPFLWGCFRTFWKVRKVYVVTIVLFVLFFVLVGVFWGFFLVVFWRFTLGKSISSDWILQTRSIKKTETVSVKHVDQRSFSLTWEDYLSHVIMFIFSDVCCFPSTVYRIV